MLANADMGPGEVRDFCRLDEAGKSLLKAAMQQLHMSARAYHRILRRRFSIGRGDNLDHNQLRADAQLCNRSIRVTSPAALAICINRFRRQGGRKRRDMLPEHVFKPTRPGYELIARCQGVQLDRPFHLPLLGR
jgi:hypothetical protein